MSSPKRPSDAEGSPATNARNSVSNSPRRSLRSVSPPKSSVGRLNFIQNDNIDEQFVQLFDMHEDIKQILFSIENESKQTSYDLGQLFERLKNNNLYLNKLLDGISTYSREVTEEGNATKSDVSRILQALAETQTQVKESYIKLEKYQKESLDQLTAFFEDAMNKQRKSGAYAESSRLISSHLDREHSEQWEKRIRRVHEHMEKSQIDMLQELRRQLSEQEFNVKLEAIEELVRRLERVVVLENSVLSEKIEGLQLKLQLEAIMHKLDTRDEYESDDSPGILDKELVKGGYLTTNGALEKRNLELVAQNLKLESDFKILTTQYAELRLNYSNLNDKYESKLKLCERIRAEFSALQQEAQQFEERMQNLDTTKYDTLHIHRKQPHRRVVSPFVEKRVLSMPHKSSKSDDE